MKGFLKKSWEFIKKGEKYLDYAIMYTSSASIIVKFCIGKLDPFTASNLIIIALYAHEVITLKKKIGDY